MVFEENGQEKKIDWIKFVKNVLTYQEGGKMLSFK